MAILLWIAFPVFAARPVIQVTLEPTHIALGGEAQLTVTISGATDTEPVLPDVDGLEFTPMGQSSQFQSINGVVTASSSRTYLVTPLRAGTFTIPALKIGSGHDAASSKPVTLQASANGSATAPRARNPHTPGLPAPKVGRGSDEDDVSANGQMAFLRLVRPKREFYVGELVPIEIQAYFRGGVQATLNGLPALHCDAFTMKQLEGKPVQSQQSVDGQPYVVLTWTTALSAVKAGDFSLSLQMPVLVRAQERSTGARGFFDDPFFDDFFGRTVEKPVTLTSDSDPVQVLALPTANRPANFSGAVGRFEITAEASPKQITAGDPITLRMNVTGRGNFDRVSSGLLGNSPEWKTYKAVARFEPADSVGFQGAKMIEQAIVPMQAGEREIPALSFSYFDPTTHQFVTRSTGAIKVEVASAAAGGATTVSPTVVQSTAAATSSPGPASPPVEELSPNRLEPGHFTSTLRPLLLRPWFWAINAAAWVGFLAAWFSSQSRDEFASDPRLKAANEADRAVRAQLAAMDVAAKRGETSAFFAAARRALQHRLGARWGLPSETITLTEIKARLHGAGDGIRPVFELADQVAYSGEALPAADLAHWKKQVHEQLKRMERI